MKKENIKSHIYFRKKVLSALMAGFMMISAFTCFNGVSAEAADIRYASYTPNTELKGKYKYVWGDEFDGTSLDSDKWSTKSPKMGGRDVLIVEDTSQTISVGDGALKLTAYKDDKGQYHVPNSVHTKETMNFKYGYVEIRAKLSLEVGSFASFWTRSVSDPGNTLVPGNLNHYAEVDIFETFQYEGKQCVGGNILKNFPGNTGNNWYATPMSWTQKATIPDEGYHIYGYEWTPTEINMYIDGKIYTHLDITSSWTGTSTEGKGLPGWAMDTTRFSDHSGTGMECFNEAQYLIFNHHLHHKDGFTASTSVTENTDFKSADYIIDYCRVFQMDGEELYAKVLPSADSDPILTGWQKENGKWYYYDDNGNKKIGWIKDGSYWYHLNSQGEMDTGWIEDRGYKYYLGPTGIMRTGWIKLEDKWYYLNPVTGAMRKNNWVQTGGRWYYLKSDGSMAVNEWVDGGKYHVNTNGVWDK